MNEFENIPSQIAETRAENNSQLKYYTHTLGSLESEGSDLAEARYLQLLAKADDLMTDMGSHGTGVLEAVFPSPYDAREWAFEEWTEQLALVPARLLGRGSPDLDHIDPQYINRVFALALPDSTPHDVTCEDRGLEEKRCPLSVNCPARVMSDISQQLLDFYGLRLAISRGRSDVSNGYLKNIALQMNAIEENTIDKSLGYWPVINEEAIKRSIEIEEFDEIIREFHD